MLIMHNDYAQVTSISYDNTRGSIHEHALIIPNTKYLHVIIHRALMQASSNISDSLTSTQINNNIITIEETIST